jgi:hypothetical protein
MWTLAHKYNQVTPQRAAEELMVKLHRFGPYIFYVSVTRSSYYIHFRSLPNKLDHKLRISNHEERERYGYKWQLRLDGAADCNIHRKKFSRYFDDPEKLVKNFLRYYEQVEQLNAELMEIQ